MNYKSIFTSLTLITVCGIALLVTILFWPRSTGFDNKGKLDRRQFPQIEESHQSWKLPPGAQVNILNVAGNVLIETGETDTAELYVERASKQKATLAAMKLMVDYQAATAKAPAILGLYNNEWLYQKIRPNFILRRLGVGQTPPFRERVVLKLPRQINLTLSDIYGDVTIGEVDGEVRVTLTQGRVEIARAAELRRLVGIKGSVEATLTKLNTDLQVGSIGGPVKLHFLQEPNARIKGDWVLGAIRAKLPGFRQTDNRFFRFQGQTGQGDKLILFRNILGSVTLDYISQPQLAKTPVSR